jgi:hypothetical protein
MYDQLLRQKTNIQKGFSVLHSVCGLCRQHLAKQIDSIVFQCSHTYHIACLEKAGCLFVVSSNPDMPGEEQWQCYSCVTKNLVRVLPSDADSASTEHQIKTSSDGVTRRDIVYEITNQRVAKAKDYMALYKSPQSYLSVVASMNNPGAKDSDFIVTRHTSVFELPDFNLKLSPDPPSSHF